MRIAVCDDEEIFIQRISRYLWQQTDCTVDGFSSPQAFLEAYEAGIRFDVVFLDIIMEPMDGILVGRSIRNYDKDVILIYLTSSREHALLGYEVKAFRYLLKPVTEEDISRVMGEIRHEFRTEEKILVRTPEGNLFLRTKDIWYLEISDKETAIYCEGDTVLLRKGLKELEMQLPKGDFFRIHRKYVVNLACVREFDDRRVTLDCGKTLPVSRRKSREFRSVFEVYIGG